MLKSILNSDLYRNTTNAGCSAGVSPDGSRLVFLTCLVAFILALPCPAQDWIRTGTGLGVEKVRLAVPDFKASTQDPKNAELLKAFNDTLWNDLDNAGIFDMVSKSFYPLEAPGNPAEVRFEAWNGPPPNASMLAFGDLGATGNSMIVHGWLYDVKNVGSPQVLGKQYTDAATPEAARTTAHGLHGLRRGTARADRRSAPRTRPVGDRARTEASGGVSLGGWVNPEGPGGGAARPLSRYRTGRLAR